MLTLIYRLLISYKVKTSKSSFAVGSKDCKEKKPDHMHITKSGLSNFTIDYKMSPNVNV